MHLNGKDFHLRFYGIFSIILLSLSHSVENLHFMCLINVYLNIVYSLVTVCNALLHRV